MNLKELRKFLELNKELPDETLLIMWSEEQEKYIPVGSLLHKKYKKSTGDLYCNDSTHHAQVYRMDGENPPPYPKNLLPCLFVSER
jgi:hypothetical protein